MKKKKIEEIELDNGEKIYFETKGEDVLGTLFFEIDDMLEKELVPTTITAKNAKQINEDTLAFISIAEGGAMGEGGAVYVMLKNKKLYYVNYLKHGEIYDKVLENLPSFEKLDFFLGYAYYVPENYVWYNLGYGNYLLVNKQFSTQFDKLVSLLDKDCQFSGQLFVRWKSMALSVLNKVQKNDSDKQHKRN